MACSQLLVHSAQSYLLVICLPATFCDPLRTDNCVLFDPVSDSVPAVVVTKIDEDSALTKAHDSLRVLLSQGKRRSVEMNTSGAVREDGAG